MPEGAWKYLVVLVEEAGGFSLPKMEDLSSIHHFLNNSFIIFNQIIHYSEITLWRNRLMLHKGRVHLFWTGGQSVALCQQPKPAHNSPKDDYANARQPSYFPRNRRRAPSRSYNCSAVMWKNKQVFFFLFCWKQSVFIKALLQYV